MRKHNEVYGNTAGMISNDNIIDSDSFKYKSRLTNHNNNVGIVNVEIAVPLKYLSNFWRTLEMPLIICEINLMLSWLVNCVIFEVDRATTFAIAGTKHYVPLVALSIQDNTKLLEQLKSEFRRSSNSSKYQSIVSTSVQNQYLDYLIDPSFQGVNRHFVLSFEDTAVRTGQAEYFLSKVEIKNYNFVIDGCNFFD